MQADKTLFILTSILIGLSILLSYSLSVYTTILFHVGQFHFVERQILFALLSLFTIWILSTLDPDKWLKPIGFSLLILSSILMLLMPILPASLVTEVGGAKRWIKIAGFSIAPVEFFKVGFVYFLSWSFSRKMGHHGGMGIKDEFFRFLPYAVVFILSVSVIALKQKDLGQSAVLGITLLTLLLFSGSSWRFFFSILGGVLIAFLYFILAESHRTDRILSWWSVAQNTILGLGIFPKFIVDWLTIPVEVEPYQIGHSLNAIHNGGIFGQGVANGTFKLGFLSEIHTDFILAGLTEEFGFIGILFVVFIFLWMLKRIFKVAMRTKDTNVYLFSLGIGLILSFAFLINAYGISGMTPIKGISVPFLSYGGSSMLGASFAVGMVLMVSKTVNMK